MDGLQGSLSLSKILKSVVYLCESLGGIHRAIKCSKSKSWKWFGISDVYGEIRPERGFISPNSASPLEAKQEFQICLYNDIPE